MHSVVSVRPSVSSPASEPTGFWQCFFAHGHGPQRVENATENRGHRSRPEVNVRCSIYCGFLWVLIDDSSGRFPLWRYQLRPSAARRAAWRGRGQRQRRSPARVGGCGNAVGLTSILHSSLSLTSECSGLSLHRRLTWMWNVLRAQLFSLLRGVVAGLKILRPSFCQWAKNAKYLALLKLGFDTKASRELTKEP